MKNRANPVGPMLGSYRVIRGGNWDSDAWRCRSAFRIWFVPENRNNSLGFRVVVMKRRSNGEKS